MKDQRARDEGRLLGLLVRATVALSARDGAADPVLLEGWARLGPNFKRTLDALRERGLVETSLLGVRLTPAGRDVINVMVGRTMSAPQPPTP
jgi:hypothetical protein